MTEHDLSGEDTPDEYDGITDEAYFAPYEYTNASPEQKERWGRRGFTDVVGDLIEDGLEKRCAVSRWEGGDTDRRVLDFPDVTHAGRFLRVTVELIPAEPP